jgi:hypothetical protein
MYSTCALPGCAVRFGGCRIHHLDPWDPTGPTDLDNLLPVCNRHHHDVHEGGWQLTMTQDRVISLRAPDGTLRFHGDTRDRAPAAAVAVATAAVSPPDDELLHDPDEPTGSAADRADALARLGFLLHRYRPDGDRLVAVHGNGSIDRHGP